MQRLRLHLTAHHLVGSAGEHEQTLRLTSTNGVLDLAWRLRVEHNASQEHKQTLLEAALNLFKAAALKLEQEGLPTSAVMQPGELHVYIANWGHYENEELKNRLVCQLKLLAQIHRTWSDDTRERCYTYHTRRDIRRGHHRVREREPYVGLPLLGRQVLVSGPSGLEVDQKTGELP